jgi:hypothetical protein
MLTFVLIFTFSLTNVVIGLPPIILRQPVESEVFFKVTSNQVEKQKQQFELVCEAEATPKPKYS